MVADLRERVETVFGKNDLEAGLAEDHLRAAADGIAVVDDEDLDGSCLRVVHGIPLLMRVALSHGHPCDIVLPELATDPLRVLVAGSAPDT